MAPMNIVFICQAVDENDSIMAGTLTWIRVLARKSDVEYIRVIALREGNYNFPDNVSVTCVGRNFRLWTLVHFYLEVVKTVLSTRAGCFFIYQGGPYPALLLPFKIFMRKRIYQWKAHPHIGPSMRFYAKFCDHKVFTSTQNAFPLELPNVRVVGQGIDVSQFCPKPVRKIGDLVTVTRVSPRKRLDSMLLALAECKRSFGVSYRLDIYGPTFKQDYGYRRDLEVYIEDLGLSEEVVFKGPVRHDQLPGILNRYRVFLNFCETALDRSVVEAMACGLPVISTNPCVEQILPSSYRLLIASTLNTAEQAEKLFNLISLNETKLSKIGQNLREIVLRDHSIEKLIGKILCEMVADEERSA